MAGRKRVSVAKSGSHDISHEDDLHVQTMRLEKQYEKALTDTNRLLYEESLRRERMEKLLLQIEVEAVQSRLSRRNEELAKVIKDGDESRVHFQNARLRVQQLEDALQASISEIETLRDELDSMNEHSAELQTAAAEKVRLNKELAKTQAELGTLKKEVESAQEILGQKRRFERLCNTLEVELENERRAHERTRAKEGRPLEEMSALSKQLEELQRDLAEERQSRQHLEQDIRRQAKEWEAERTMLDKELAALRKKLQATKTKLQQKSQEESSRARISGQAVQTDDSNYKTQKVPASRPSAPFNPDITIATPGAVKAREGSKKPTALPGDKSSFSITPFLSRTGAPAGSPSASDSDSESQGSISRPDTNELPHKDRPLSGTSSVLFQTEQRAVPLNDAAEPDKKQKGNKRRLKTTAAASKTTELQNKLPTIADHDDEPSTAAMSQSFEDANNKIKRRKLVGQRDRTIFDDDDDDAEVFGGLKRPGQKLGLGLSRPVSLNTTSTAARDLFQSLGTNRPAQFSPLKRDRKRN